MILYSYCLGIPTCKQGHDDDWLCKPINWGRTSVNSNMARARHCSQVAVAVPGPNAKRSGLLIDSVNMMDNLATINASAIDRVIGNFAAMTQVDSALAVPLALPRS